MKKITINEAQLLSLENILQESYGIFQGCSDLAVKIADEIYNHWILKGKVEDIAVPCEWAIGKCIIIHPTSFNVRASYILDVEEIGGTVIFVNPRIVDFKDESIFLSTLMHELTHAYKDAMKRRNGSSERETAIKSGYNQNFDYRFRTSKNDNNPIKQDLSAFLYYCSAIERDAFYAGMYGKLHFCLGEISTPQEALDVIKSTREYKQWMAHISNVKQWLGTTDKYKQQLLTQYAFELTNKRFTFSGLCKYLQRLIWKVENKLNKNIRKMILACLEEET